jgi:hypothetical protein
VDALLEGVKTANLALRFLLELCALVALGYWGFKTGGGLITKLALGIGAPLLAAVVWGTFLAPRAAVPTPGLLRLVLELGGLRISHRRAVRRRTSRPGLDVGGTLRDQPRPHQLYELTTH